MRRSELKRSCFHLIALLLCLCSHATSTTRAADSDEWSVLMEKGRKAFNDADHSAATKFFTQARALVKDAPPEDGRYSLTLGAMAKNHLALWQEKEAGVLYKEAATRQGGLKPRDPVAWGMVLIEYAEYDVQSGGRGQVPLHNGHQIITYVAGHETAGTAAYYRSLALINWNRGSINQALFDAKRAWDHATKFLKPEDLEYAMCASQYADVLLADPKNRDEAMRLLLIADKGMALHLNKNHYYVMRNRHLIATAQIQAKNFKEGLESLLSIHDGYVRLGGKDSLRVVNLKVHIAICYENLKEHDKAVPEYEHCVAVFMKAKIFANGYRSEPNASRSAIRLAHCYFVLGRMEEHSRLIANELPYVLINFSAPVDMRTMSADVMRALINREQYKDAAAFGEKMIAHFHKHLGDLSREVIRHKGPDGQLKDYAVAHFYSALPMKSFEIRWAQQMSLAYEKSGDAAKAKFYADHVIAMQEETAKSLGNDTIAQHIQTAAAMIDDRKWVDAMMELDQAMKAKSKINHLIYASATDAEKELLVLRDARLAYLVLTVAALVVDADANNPDAGRISLDAILGYKAAEIETAAREQRLAATSTDPQIKALSQSLSKQRRELAALVLEEDNPAIPKKNVQAIAALEKSIATLERNLSVKSATFAQMHAQSDVNWKTLSDKLPPDTVFITYSRAAHVVKSPYGRHWLWLAVTVKRGEQPRLHLLPDDSELDAEERRIKASVALNPGRPDNPNARLDSYARHMSDGGYRVSHLKLKPMWDAIKDSKRWIISPDSHLANVPWALIPQPDSGQPVIDDYEVSTMTTGHEIAQFGKPRPHNNEALIVAAPNFDATVQQGDLRRPLVRDGSLKNLTWSPLPGTEKEGLAISASLKKARIKTTLLTGEKATKHAVLEAKSPRFLHIATHGYFLPQSRMFLQVNPFSQIKLLIDEEGTIHETPLEPLNALLYSGLALAGSNKEEAGLLTAYELGGMNLWGTQIVVLSACDTGRGAETIGSGVTGLQRAVMQAGAQTLVMSLWPVPDEETASLMDLFYKHLLGGKRPALALRQAMLDLRKQLEADGNDSPRSWGAFVVHGDPG